METFSALLAICEGNSPVPGEFPAQRPMTRSFGVFFDLCLNKPLSKPGLEGFGRYPVFTAVFTGKYRPGKNRFWTPKVGKNREKHNLGLFLKQFSTSIKDLIGPWIIWTQELIIFIHIQNSNGV